MLQELVQAGCQASCSKAFDLVMYCETPHARYPSRGLSGLLSSHLSRFRTCRAGCREQPYSNARTLRNQVQLAVFTLCRKRNSAKKQLQCTL
jgi:hypothetical protein